jgi:hypothetical protein
MLPCPSFMMIFQEACKHGSICSVLTKTHDEFLHMFEVKCTVSEEKWVVRWKNLKYGWLTDRLIAGISTWRSSFEYRTGISLCSSTSAKNAHEPHLAGFFLSLLSPLSHCHPLPLPHSCV